MQSATFITRGTKLRTDCYESSEIINDMQTCYLCMIRVFMQIDSFVKRKIAFKVAVKKASQALDLSDIFGN